jgi:hypothetical protein
VLAALLLAGVRNIQPRPVGFKFHAVLVVNSAHLALARRRHSLPGRQKSALFLSVLIARMAGRIRSEIASERVAVRWQYFRGPPADFRVGGRRHTPLLYGTNSATPR